VMLVVGAAATSAGAEDTLSPSASPELVQDYCAGFRNEAADMRMKLQMDELHVLQKEIETQAAELASKTAALSELVSAHEQLLATATKDIIKIYASVEPEAAAKQLQQIAPDEAAAILRKLQAKRSGEILSTMETKAATDILRSMVIQMDSKPQGGKS
jgi:flagellar motility protein MotE (MotC chaperone)